MLLRSPSSGKGEVFYITGKAFNRWCVNPRGTKPENKHRWDCTVRGKSDGINGDRFSFNVSDFPFYEKKGAVLRGFHWESIAFSEVLKILRMEIPL